MKNQINAIFKPFLLLLAVALAPLAQAQSTDVAGLRYWVDSEKREVIFVHPAVLAIHWADLRVDDEFWAMVTVDLSFKAPPGIDESLSRLRSKYPDYKLVRALIDGSPALRLQVPSIGINREVSTLPSIDGPYYQENLMIKRADAEKARKAFGKDFLHLSGSIEPRVATSQVLEQKTLGPDVCNSLLPEGTSVLGLVRNMGQLKQTLLANLKYPETRQALMTSMLSECIETPDLSNIRGFTDLFEFKPIRNPHPGKISGEAKKVVRQEASVPIEYVVVQEAQP